MREFTTEQVYAVQPIGPRRAAPRRALLQSGWRWLRGAWPVLLILALPVVLLQHSLFGGGATTGGDILVQQPPWSVDLVGQVGSPQNPVLFDEPYEVSAWFLFTRHELLSGRFPFWNPYVAGGTPFFAADQPAVLYPLTLLRVVLPYPLGMTLMALFKWWLAGLGMYVFGRASLRLGQVAALAAALSFMLSSFIVAWLVHPVGSAATLLAWVCWASERVIDRPTGRCVARLAVIAALVAFSGHPEMAFHVLLGASLYVLWLIVAWGEQPWRVRLRRLMLWVGGMVLGIALAAVQLLPIITLLPRMLGTVMRSDNYGGIDIQLSGVLTWLVPNLWGNPALNHSYWGPRNYNEEVWYAGAVALALASVALLAVARAHGWLNRRAVSGLLLGLLLCDQLLFAAPYVPQPPSSLAYPQTPTVARLQQTVGSARMAASGTLLEPDSLTPYRLRDIRAYDPTVSSRYVQFMLALDPGLGKTNAYCCQFLDCPSAVLLGVASVEYYVTLPGEDPNRCIRLSPGQKADSGPYVALWTQGGITLWHNTLARPRFYFAGQVLPAANERISRDALATLRGGDLATIIEGAPAGAGSVSMGRGTLRVMTDLPGQIELRTLTERPRWVVINEGYEPGWQADLDGAAVTIYPANVMFQAVLVPAGTHTLRFLYRPTGYVPGLVISVAALLVLLGLLASEWVARRLLKSRPVGWLWRGWKASKRS